MKTYASVVSAEPLPDFRVQVVFDTGDPFWNRLSDPAFFRLVRVACGTLVWPDDIDIAPEDVWERTVRDAPTAVLPAFVAKGPATYDGKPV